MNEPDFSEGLYCGYLRERKSVAAVALGVPVTG
jgi:hypothetical protein